VSQPGPVHRFHTRAPQRERIALAAGTVGVPFYRFISSEFLEQLNRLEQPEGSLLLYKPGFEPADQRNWLVENFTGDWLLQIDSDQAFDPQSLVRLLETGLDIVGGVYYQRGGDFLPAIFRATGEKDASGKWQYRSMRQELVDYLRDHKDEAKNTAYQVFAEPHPLEVDAMATGFLLVRRRVFEKIAKPWFSFVEQGTEDLYFCRRAKEAGFKIHADLSVQVGHFTSLPVGYLHFLAREGVIR
jgi:glycosyltransferase involved in cell wall biosynthesis